ncbi:MAG TPA: hypothetical protein VJK29_22875, partial [Terriglobales bacterium]|nr:hypothetical protein [Terriglobales bacterium]
FGRVKISVIERTAIAVAPSIGKLRILPTPELDPAFLLATGGSGEPASGHNGRLEVVGQGNHEMDWTGRQASREPLPCITGQDAETS